jgi:acetolactate synthase small subunit
VTEQRWVFVVKCLDRPGSLTAAASVFSNRGVSLEAILSSGIAATSIEAGRLILSFRATERKKEMLMRALGRLSSVSQVDHYLYDDPALRSIALAKVSSSSAIEFSSDLVQAETISETAESTMLLLTGNPVAVESMIETLRQRSFLLDLVTAAIAI